MAYNETREVKTYYTCDFCKHTEVSVAEYAKDGLPKGWNMLAMVPWDQRPQVGVVDNKYYAAYSEDPKRYCLSADKEISPVHACPECSVYGLHVIKRANKEEPTKEAPAEIVQERGVLKLTRKTLNQFLGTMALACFGLGLFIGFFIKR